MCNNTRISNRCSSVCLWKQSSFKNVNKMDVEIYHTKNSRRVVLYRPRYTSKRDCHCGSFIHWCVLRFPYFYYFLSDISRQSINYPIANNRRERCLLLNLNVWFTGTLLISMQLLFLSQLRAGKDKANNWMYILLTYCIWKLVRVIH